MFNPNLVFRGSCETLVQMKGLLQRGRSKLEVIVYIMSACMFLDLSASDVHTSILSLNLLVILLESL